MKVYLHKHFLKQFKNLPKKIQSQFYDRVELYLEDNIHPLLNIHRLQGDEYPQMSLNVTSDYRALFLIEDDKVTFYKIGTHSELYK